MVLVWFGSCSACCTGGCLSEKTLNSQASLSNRAVPGVMNSEGCWEAELGGGTWLCLTNEKRNVFHAEILGSHEEQSQHFCLCGAAISRAELESVFIPYDLKRLEMYSRNMVDYHLIMDMVPTLARMFFLNQMGSVSLSAAQSVRMAVTTSRASPLFVDMFAVVSYSTSSLKEDLPSVSCFFCSPPQDFPSL